MFDRRAVLGGFAVTAFAGRFVSPAAAVEPPARFTTAAFEAALGAGGPLLVEVSAPWCPTCRAQKPILAALRADPRFARLTMLEVDFDSQKDALKLLRVQRQSTLVVFKGGREVGRSVGDTSRAGIAALLEKTL